MRYLKTYENFQLGGEIWGIMDEDEQYMYADAVTGSKESHLASTTTFILVPIENLSIGSFKKHGYKTEKEASTHIDFLKRSVELNNDNIIIGFGTPNYKITPYVKRLEDTDYKRTFNFEEEEKLKPVKFFMGVMKEDENEDKYLNL